MPHMIRSFSSTQDDLNAMFELPGAEVGGVDLEELADLAGEEDDGGGDGDDLDSGDDKKKKKSKEDRGRRHFPDRHGCSRFFGTPSCGRVSLKGFKVEPGKSPPPAAPHAWSPSVLTQSCDRGC